MRKPKGYWQNRENVTNAVLEIAEKAGWTEIPSYKKLRADGMPEVVYRHADGREGIAKITGLPLKKGYAKNPLKEANRPAMEKWDGKPSKAFEIEAEARKVGLSYADIQKRKTLELVGGVSV